MNNSQHPVDLSTVSADELRTMREELRMREAEIDNALAARRQAEIRELRAHVTEQCAKLGITPEELLGMARKAPPTGAGRSVVRPKWRDPVSGDTWSGRGTPKEWLRTVWNMEHGPARDAALATFRV